MFGVQETWGSGAQVLAGAHTTLIKASRSFRGLRRHVHRQPAHLPDPGDVLSLHRLTAELRRLPEGGLAWDPWLFHKM